MWANANNSWRENVPRWASSRHRRVQLRSLGRTRKKWGAASNNARGNVKKSLTGERVRKKEHKGGTSGSLWQGENASRIRQTWSKQLRKNDIYKKVVCWRKINSKRQKAGIFWVPIRSSTENCPSHKIENGDQSGGTQKKDTGNDA